MSEKRGKKKKEKSNATNPALLVPVNKEDLGSSYGQFKDQAKGSSQYDKRLKPKGLGSTTSSTGSSLSSAELSSMGGASVIIKSKGFELISKLGSGNYANVYKLRDVKTNKEVAVKVIDLTKASENYRVRFLPREMDILQKVKHKHIIAVHEIIQSQKRVFIFMELATNGTVADFLKKHGPIPEWLSHTMFLEVGDALRFMHSMNVAHRDLKVENILLNRNLRTSEFNHRHLILIHF